MIKWVGRPSDLFFFPNKHVWSYSRQCQGPSWASRGKVGLQVSLVPPEKAAGSVGLGASAQMGGGKGPAPSSFHLQVQPPGSSEGPTMVASPETRSGQPRPVLCSEPAGGCGRTALGRLGDPLWGTAEVFPDPLLRSSPEPALTAHGTCGGPPPK